MQPFQSSLHFSLRTMFFAAVAAFVLHAAFVAAVATCTKPSPESELGAPAVEIGIELLAKRDQPTDLPPGPDTDDSAPSVPVPEQTKIVDPADLPRERPIETDDPDRVVTPVATKKPQDDPKVTPQVSTTPTEAAIPSQATARPSATEMEESPRSVAPVQGSGESPQRVRANWIKELIAHLDRHKRFPANQSGDRAEILINLALDSEGHVLSASIARGSGQSSFDEAALAMIRRANPVPRPPAIVARGGLNFTLPVIFRAPH